MPLSVRRLAGGEVVRADDRGVHVARRRTRRQLRVEHALHAPLDVGRRDLAAHRRVEHDALAQVEGPGLAVVRDAAVRDGRHLGREVGRHDRGAGTGDVGEHLVEDAVLDRPRFELPGDRRVEAGGLALEGDAECAALRGRTAGRRRRPAAARRTAAGRQHLADGGHRQTRDGRARDQLPARKPSGENLVYEATHAVVLELGVTAHWPPSIGCAPAGSLAADVDVLVDAAVAAGVRRWRAASSPAPLLRVEGVAQTVADQVEGEHCDHDAQAREQHEPRSARVVGWPSEIICPHEGVGGCTPRPM